MLRLNDANAGAKTLAGFLWLGALVFGLSSAQADCVWEGAKLADWVKGTGRHLTHVRLEGDVLKGTVTGLDPIFSVPFPVPVQTRANHVLYLTLKTTCGGKAQFFWRRPGDKDFSGYRCSEVGVSSDGQWHTYRMLLDWFAADCTVTHLRFDLMGSEEPYDFEVKGIRIVEEGEAVDVKASDAIGVAFSLQMPPGVHYCTVEWLREGSGLGSYYFASATDGLKHDYWFNLTESGKDRQTGVRLWDGHIVRCRVRQRKTGIDLPVENFRFVKAKPETPSDVSIVTVQASDAIERAGRPFPVEVILRNYGTRPGEQISFAFDGLPDGVRVLEPATLAPGEALPGSLGQESILSRYRYCSPPLASERRYVFRLSDLGVGTHRLGLTLRAAGQAPRRTEFVTEVKPSLNLASCDYPPEPKPVKTGPYQVGAVIFPGWMRHTWEPDWVRAPWRKPVLGWYDESQAETIDWQIKHLVENGLSFVCVNWYWSDGVPGKNHWMDDFRKARYRRHLKWFVQWSNHNRPGSHSVADQEKVARYWIENYFSDPQYMRIDGKPVVTIYCPQNMERDMKGRGGCKALLDVTRRAAVAAGYPGIFFLGMRGLDRDSRSYLEPFESMGFDATTVYHYTATGMAGSPLGADGSRPFSWVAQSSYDHWKRLHANSKLPIWPSLSTGRDDRVWNGERAEIVITCNNAPDFRTICRSAKRFSDETGLRFILMAPLDEWSEGEIGYPNKEHGFGFFEAVRDTFGEKGAGGWPVNYAPEDVGRVCPQLDLVAYWSKEAVAARDRK